MSRSARWLARAVVLTSMGFALGTAHCNSDEPTYDPRDRCSQPDQDGVIGGSYTFEVKVSDTAFAPVILKAQNAGNIQLAVENIGTKAHGFTVDCLSAQGCVACFPEAANVGQLAPGTRKTVTFTAPEQEGIYTIRSDAAGDAFTAQFVLE